MEFETVQFYDYNIRSTVIDNVRMFLVSDLLNQYNEKNNRNKKFRNYLKNDQTKELLNNWLKYTGGSNSNLQCQPCTKHSKWNIDNVIKYTTFNKSFGTASQGYVVCEELLIACLMWADPKFAIAVYTFLKDQRAKDNNFLQQTIQQLQAENNKLVKTQKQMQNRHVHDEKEYQST